jgi:hypothetical protein
MPPAPSIPSPPTAAELRRAYRDEVAAALRRRFALGAVLYLLAAGAAVVLEYRYHGARGDTRLHLWLVEVAVWAAALVALSVRRLRPWTTAVVSGVTALIVVLLL